MPDPLRLAATAVELGIAHYGRRGSRGTAASIALVVVAVICAGTGGGFAVAALLIYLVPIVGAAGAALVVAAALFALAGLALALSHYYRPQSSHARHSTEPPDFQKLAAGAEDFIRENKAVMLLAAFIAGLLAVDEGSRPR
jgi:hypothetical protein